MRSSYVVPRTRLWLLSTIAIAILSATVLLLSYNNNTIQSLARTQDSNNDLRKERAVVGGHTPGYGVIETSGDILDPISLNITLKNAAVDPVKYLHEFNYGRVFELPNETTLREFTLVASDDKIKEISPGVFLQCVDVQWDYTWANYSCHRG